MLKFTDQQNFIVRVTSVALRLHSFAMVIAIVQVVRTRTFVSHIRAARSIHFDVVALAIALTKKPSVIISMIALTAMMKWTCSVNRIIATDQTAALLLIVLQSSHID